MKKYFDGTRIQKISVNAGFTCPNRDGSKGTGGCTFCNNQTFVPEYCQPTKSVRQQVEEGIAFFKHKYATQRYLVYFQSYTNTYGNISHLKNIYEEALSHPNVEGIVVGTRPDCVDEELLTYFSALAKEKFVLIEYGVESVHDKTLLHINRGHDFSCSKNAIEQSAARGIHTGAHLILGLPGETHDMIMESAHHISTLPLDTLKLHQLQLVKGTAMEKEYLTQPEKFHFYEADEYIDLVIDFLEQLRPNIAIERFVSQSPKELLIKPKWGYKNFEFTAKIEKRLKERNTWQGRLYKTA